MQFHFIQENIDFKIGKIFWFYLGSLLFTLVFYFLFLKQSINQYLILIIAFIFSSLIILFKILKNGKHKIFFKGLREGFKEFGYIISNIINFFLFLIVFIFGVGLVSIFLKIKKKNLLNLKNNSETNWVDKKSRNKNMEDSLKPF